MYVIHYFVNKWIIMSFSQSLHNMSVWGSFANIIKIKQLRVMVLFSSPQQYKTRQFLVNFIAN